MTVPSLIFDALLSLKTKTRNNQIRLPKEQPFYDILIWSFCNHLASNDARVLNLSLFQLPQGFKWEEWGHIVHKEDP